MTSPPAERRQRAASRQGASPTRQDESAPAAAALASFDAAAIDQAVNRSIETSPSPKLFWLLQIAGWAGYFLLDYVTGMAQDKPMGYWKLPVTTALAGFVITLGLRYVLRYFWRLPPRQLILVMLPATLLASALIGCVFIAVQIDWCGEMCRPKSALGYAARLFTYLYVVLAWVGFYIGIKYYRQLRKQTEAALAANAMAHQAQLKMLRYQLNPHFLFNTLNAISTLVLDRDNDSANRMVQKLSAFLRHSLDNDPIQRVTLKQELDALNLYLDIEKVRFAERLRIEFDIDPACEDALVPSLLLQPLIENAIKHAVAKQVQGGCLEIGARAGDDGMLRLRVADDGPGAPELARLMSGGDNGRGVGLANTRERLQVLYGSRQRVRFGNRQPHGVEVLIDLPLEKAVAAKE